MIEQESNLEHPQDIEFSSQPDEVEGALLPEGITVEVVRNVAQECDLGVTYEEILETYQEVHEGTEEDFVYDVYEAGEGQQEEGDSIETIIEIGLNIMALSLGLT